MISKANYYNYPGTEKNARDFHYSQVVKVGSVLKTSGQGGWDADGNIATNLKAQIAQAFENVLSALRAADNSVTWANVISVRSYHIDVAQSFDLMTENFKRLGPNHLPVWTCVEVSKLGLDGMVVEMEVEAAV